MTTIIVITLISIALHNYWRAELYKGELKVVKRKLRRIETQDSIDILMYHPEHGFLYDNRTN